MLHSVSSGHGTTELKLAVLRLIRERDAHVCYVCKHEIPIDTRPNMRWIDVNGEAVIENLVIVHHGCVYGSRDIRIQPPLKTIEQIDDAMKTVHKDSVLVCSVLHCGKHSQIYMARTCKHFLCGVHEMQRQQDNGCPACVIPPGSSASSTA